MSAYEVLRENQRQLGADGTEVGVSRQALDEVLDGYQQMSEVLSQIEELRKNNEHD